MTLEYVLDDLHVAFTRRWWTQAFTAFTRCLLALAFIPPSITKILHHPFTVLPDANPVGHYFNALMGTGFYYEFIGWAQLTAAILLMIPRTSHIGAVLFLPIIANIAVLTTSVGFQGTWLLAILMSLAALYLVAWEFDRLKPLLLYTREDSTRRMGLRLLWFPAFFAAGGVLMGALWWMIGLGNFSNYGIVTAGLAALGFVFGYVVALHFKLMPVGRVSKNKKVLWLRPLTAVSTTADRGGMQVSDR